MNTKQAAEKVKQAQPHTRHEPPSVAKKQNKAYRAELQRRIDQQLDAEEFGNWRTSDGSWSGANPVK